MLGYKGNNSHGVSRQVVYQLHCLMYGLEHHPLFSVAFPLVLVRAYSLIFSWPSARPPNGALPLNSFFGFCDAIWDQKKCTLGFALFLLLDLETTIWVIQLACWAVGDHRASAFLSPQSTTKSQQTNEWSHLRPTSPHTPYKLTSDTWANTTEISQACPSWQNSPADP